MSITSIQEPTGAEVVIVGGGPAGLQAALTLGRVHRDVVVFDDGRYRNAPATHLHNVLTRDGLPPAEFRAIARAELAAYPTVRVAPVRVADLRPDGGRFTVVPDEGATLTVHAIILATGVRDVLPAVPGMAGLWGRRVAQCPFCHAHEFRGGRFGVYAAGQPMHLPHLCGLLAPVAGSLVAIPGEAEPPAGLPAGVTVRRSPVAVVEEVDDAVVVRYADGTAESLDVLFCVPELVQAAPFAQRLGLEMLPSGCVRVDGFGRSSLPGVFCSGDMAHPEGYPRPLASVISAAAAGSVAAVGLTADLVAGALPGRG